MECAHTNESEKLIQTLSMLEIGVIEFEDAERIHSHCYQTLV